MTKAEKAHRSDETVYHIELIEPLATLEESGAAKKAIVMGSHSKDPRGRKSSAVRAARSIAPKGMKPLRETLKPRPPGPVDSIEKEIAHDEMPVRDVNADMPKDNSPKAKSVRHAAYKALPAKLPRDRIRITREERVVLGNLPDDVIRTELARREMTARKRGAMTQGWH